MVFTKPFKTRMSLDLARERPEVEILGADHGDENVQVFFAWVTGDAIELVLFFETGRHKFPFHLLNFPVSSLSAAKNNCGKCSGKW